MLLARESLTIAQAARLQAASAFLCSNQMNVDDQSVIDVSGGGCSASSRYSQQPAGGISVPGPAKGGPWLAGGCPKVCMTSQCLFCAWTDRSCV